jgi:hypothetical protein
MRLSPEGVIRERYRIGLERVNGYTVNIVNAFPNITTMGKGTICGMMNWTDKKNKQMYMLKDCVLSQFGFPQTVSQITGDYVKVLHNRLRAKREAIAIYDQALPPPIYMQPCIIRDGVYLDLSAAFPTIYRASGLNCDYWPGRYLMLGDHCEDFPLKDHKVARSSVVMMGWSASWSVWDGTKLNSITKKGSNRGLYRLVMDVLNGLAVDMFANVPIRYAYTDGYILPYSSLERATAIVESWGFKWKIKARGYTQIDNVNSYTCGDTTTKPFGKVARGKTWSNFASLPQNHWLRDRIVWCGQMRNKECTDLVLPTIDGILNLS